MSLKRIKIVARAIRGICSCSSREAIKRARDIERRNVCWMIRLGHDWSYQEGGKRRCKRCAARQYVAVETFSGETSWEAES